MAQPGVVPLPATAAEPQPGAGLGAMFETLGRLAAIAHDHASRFTPPRNFTRQRWSAATILDPDGLWGDWRAAPGVSRDVATTLATLDAALRAALADYGDGRERFGLIHVDFPTQKRIIKDSARWFARTIATNGSELSANH